MIWVAPNLSLFFAWQFLTGLFAAVVTAVAAYRITNPARVPPNWRGMMEIRGVLFGAGQMLLLFAIASSLDKFFLPRFVSAADYGIYVAIGQLAIGNFIVIYPIWAAFHPRLLAAIAANDARSIRQTFLSAAGVMIALCCAFIVGTMIATPAILHLWVGPRETGFELVLILVAAGYGLLAMSHLALTIHQAAGRYFPTPLIFAAAIVIVPTVGYLTLQRIDVNAVAALWMLIYAIEFLAGAFAFRLYAPQLAALARLCGRSAHRGVARRRTALTLDARADNIDSIGSRRLLRHTDGSGDSRQQSGYSHLGAIPSGEAAGMIRFSINPASPDA